MSLRVYRFLLLPSFLLAGLEFAGHSLDALELPLPAMLLLLFPLNLVLAWLWCGMARLTLRALRGESFEARDSLRGGRVGAVLVLALVGVSMRAADASVSLAMASSQSVALGALALLLAGWFGPAWLCAIVGAADPAEPSLRAAARRADGQRFAIVGAGLGIAALSVPVYLLSSLAGAPPWVASSTIDGLTPFLMPLFVYVVVRQYEKAGPRTREPVLTLVGPETSQESPEAHGHRRDLAFAASRTG